MDTILIRPEVSADQSAIYDLVRSAFADRPYAAGDEQDLVNRLREVNALAVALVAEQNQQVVGHIAFSPVTLSEPAAPWFGLGPVAVLPALQGQGIGAQLIRSGLDAIKTLGAGGCVLTGNPTYYSRFGFVLAPDNCPKSEPREYFQMLTLGTAVPAGPVEFHPAFYEG